jgi:Domain of unknown function (DUF4399)/Protein of unknown function (DUF3551)
MRHALICVSLAIMALAVERSPAAAQSAWCAYYKGGSGTSCGFATFEQCLASVSGVGGTCGRNPAAGRSYEGGVPARSRISREEQRAKARQAQKARQEQQEQRARARKEQKSREAAPQKVPPSKPETPATPPVAATAAPPTNTARKSAAQDARVYFVGLQNGAEISSPATIVFGLIAMGIAPAGLDNPNTGHHHLLIDTKLPNMDQPIPSDFNHLHFGAGQSEASVTLQPGKHTLQLLFADENHVPHNPPIMSAPITVTVKTAK